jgi:hypothetical protein
VEWLLSNSFFLVNTGIRAICLWKSSVCFLHTSCLSFGVWFALF